jgi:pilus assembly protein CpaB
MVLVAPVAAVLIAPAWGESPRTNSRVATVPVVVAAKDMPEGVLVDRMALVVAQWPAGTQPAGAYATVDSVAGRVTRVAVYKGEAFVPGRLAPEGTGAGLEVKITPGKRAYGIRINDVAGLTGMVQPNSRVDVMAVIDDPDNECGSGISPTETGGAAYHLTAV